MSYQYTEIGWYWGEIWKRDFVNASHICPQNFGFLSKKSFYPAIRALMSYKFTLCWALAMIDACDNGRRWRWSWQFQLGRCSRWKTLFLFQSLDELKTDWWQQVDPRNTTTEKIMSGLQMPTLIHSWKGSSEMWQNKNQLYKQKLGLNFIKFR